MTFDWGEFIAAHDETPPPPETWMMAQLELAGFFSAGDDPDEIESIPAFMYRASVLAVAKRNNDALQLMTLSRHFQTTTARLILERAPLPLWGISPLLWGLLGPMHLIK